MVKKNMWDYNKKINEGKFLIIDTQQDIIAIFSNKISYKSFKDAKESTWLHMLDSDIIPENDTKSYKFWTKHFGYEIVKWNKDKGMYVKETKK